MESCDLNDVMRAIGNLEGSVKEGFEGIHRRQDIANGRLDRHDKQIQGLEAVNSEEKGRRSAFSWVGGVVTFSIGTIAGLVGSVIQAGWIHK